MKPVRPLTRSDVLGDRLVFATLTLMVGGALAGWWLRYSNQLDFSVD